MSSTRSGSIELDSPSDGRTTGSTQSHHPPTLQRMNGGLAVIVGIMVIAALYFARPFAVPMTGALLLSFLLRPPVSVLKKMGLPRAMGAVTVMTVVGIVFVSAVMLMMPFMAQSISDLPETLASMHEKLNGVNQSLGEFMAMFNDFSQIANSAEDGEAVPVKVQSNDLLTAMLGNTGSALIGIMLSVVLAFFLVASDERVLIRAGRLLPSLDDKRRATQVLRSLETEVSVYLLTLTTINIGVGLVMTLAAWMLGVEKPWMMGLVAGLLNFVPYLGGIGGFLMISVMGLIAFDDVGQGMLPGLAFLVINGFEAYVFSPMIYGERLRLNPVAILIGLMFFSWLWGLPGAVMAVPLLVVVKVTCGYVPRWRAVGDLLGPVGKEKYLPGDGKVP